MDPLLGIQRAHVELYIHQLGDTGLMDSSIVTMMHGVRGFFRFAHIDGLIAADPAVYARLPKVQHDESRTQGLDRLELIRFLQVAQTLTVHHGALAFLLGINTLRASEAVAVRIEDYAEILRGHRVLHLVSKGNKPATMPFTSLSSASWRHGEVSEQVGHSSCDPPQVVRSTAVTPIAWLPGSQGLPASRDTSARTHCATPPSPTLSMPESRYATPRSWPRHADPRTTEHYDRARGNLDRHGVHFLTAYVAGA